ncbi:hypothetical protein LX15_005391 [Streptoalloteichus tenebrarius]|uniref:DUF5313 domain-containing protein n=1 Tax=Streptoalloteichus tenebrarius (strain ATCC 17920 / DSM 40477 / JCM 4838 / CBS 697.72 / NBRC 16177 / NCIMB 11028 / NRRL B-12390 / A12253. 1 / ISP 5477) TaxID=1933 RepID=A0ABT1I264_STRSD|nr:DUF5313 domain-containing protein [Streptoalloteichus tenebrarius]MCP2261665.1 hypothetical protein [Streptoalloteichus tenebrarius]BFE99149.1 hypothetical protein GCM10020241_08250 [Streptoalloteichus tenebrarius]
MGAARPNPIQWLWYAVGGRLPERLREWVLHDVTCRTWVWRHAARSTVLIGPISLACLLVPGPIEIRLGMVGLAVLVGYYFSFSYMEENCEHRVTKHGYAPGTARNVRRAAREEKHAEAHAQARARYEARYRQASSPDSDQT